MSIVEDYQNALAAQARRAQANVSAQEVPPNEAADAIKLEPQAGPASATMYTLPATKQQVENQQTNDIITQSPAMARWAQSDPSRVAATKDDFGKLHKVSTTVADAADPGFWEYLNKTFITPPEQRDQSIVEALQKGVDPGEYWKEIKKEFKGAVKGFLTDMVTPRQQQWWGNPDAPPDSLMNALGAVASPVTGTIASSPGARIIEQQTGISRSTTAQAVLLALPLPKALGEIGLKETPAEPILRQAQAESATLNVLRNTVKDTATHARSPEVAQEFIQQQTEGTPIENLKIDGQKVMDAYEKASKFPFKGDGILGFQPDIYEQIQRHILTGSDVEVPLSSYLAHVDDASHAIMEPGIRLHEDGVSLDEAALAKEALGEEQVLPSGTKVEFGKVHDTGGRPATEPYNALDQSGLSPEEKATVSAAASAARHASKEARMAYLKPLFETPEAAGMTKEQFARYSEQVQAAHAKVDAALVGKAERDIKKQRSSEWKAQSESEFNTTLKEVQSRPNVNAYSYLETGRLADGKEFLGDGIKLSAEGLLKELKEALPPSIFAKESPEKDFSSSVAKSRDHSLLTLYHGTVKDFENFSKKGTATGAKDAKLGYFFTSNPEVASSYAMPESPDYLNQPGISGKIIAATEKLSGGIYSKFTNWLNEKLFYGEEKPNVRPVNLNVKKPLIIEPETPKEYSEKFFTDTINRAKKEGYDAVVFKKQKDWGYGEEPEGIHHDVWVVFKPEQIRSSFRGVAHPDDIAEFFGYGSGTEMLEDIARLEDARKALGVDNLRQYMTETARAATQTKLLAEIGDLTPDAIHAAAREAVAEPEVTTLLATELNGLAKQAGLPFEKGNLITEAKKQFSSFPIKSAIKIREFERQVLRYAKQAEMALLKGKLPEAFIAKQRQFMQQVMLGEAHGLRQRALKANTDYKRWAKSTTMAGVEQSYLDYVHAAVSQLGYKIARTPAEIMKNTGGVPLLDFVNNKWMEGQIIHYQPWAPAKLQEMPVGDFRNADDTIRSLIHNGREEGRFIQGNKIQDRKDLLDALAQQRARLGDRYTLQQLTDREKGSIIGSAFRAKKAELTAPDFIMRKLDGDDSTGVFNETLMEPLQKGKHLEDDLGLAFAKALREFGDAHKEQAKSFDEKLSSPALKFVDADGQSTSIVRTKRDLIGAAMHWGNPENKEALTKGFNIDASVWQAAFDHFMKPEDWDFVQFMWDRGDAIYDQSREMYKRLSGVYPLKTEKEAFFANGKKYAGGHAPLFYDEILGPQVKGKNTGLMERIYGAARPSQGYIFSRTGYHAPLDLDLENIKYRYGQMIHDVAFREAIINADKFLKEEPVGLAITKMAGPEYRKELKDWVARIAGSRFYDPRAIQGWSGLVHSQLNKLNAVAIMFRLSTVLKHGVTAFAKSVDTVGTGPLLGAYKELFAGDPFKNIEKLYQESGELRHRAINFEQNWREAANDVMAKRGLISQSQIFGSHLVYWSDQFSAAPVYIAAKRSALEKGLTNTQAVSAGDRAVRMAHGSGTVVDLPALLATDNVWAKVFTRFMTSLVNGLNRQMTMAGNFKSLKENLTAGNISDGRRDMGKIAARSFILVGVPALVAEYFEGDPKNNFFTNFAEAVTWSMASGIPYLRTFVDGLFHAKAVAKGRSDVDFDPFNQMASTVVGTVGNAASIVQGEPTSNQALRKAMESTGYITGLGGMGQAGASSQYLWDIKTGRTHPRNPGEFAEGVLFGPRYEHERNH